MTFDVTGMTIKEAIDRVDKELREATGKGVWLVAVSGWNTLDWENDMLKGYGFSSERGTWHYRESDIACTEDRDFEILDNAFCNAIENTVLWDVMVRVDEDRVVTIKDSELTIVSTAREAIKEMKASQENIELLEA